MLIDHANAILFDWHYTWAYLIGRAAFPLFCWAAAAAVLRARDSRAVYKQAGILLALAVLVEPVSRITRDYDICNVLLTLGLGVLLAPFYMGLNTFARWAASLLAIGISFCGGWWEFGTAGMLLPAALAMAMQSRRPSDIIIALLLLAAANFRGLFFYPVYNADMIWATILAATLLPAGVLWVVRDITARLPAAPMVRRLLPRYFLHIFYPLHMLALWFFK